jgi:hypothetical protein
MTAQVMELFGYAASFFVAVSLLMVSLVRLRILNLIGCTFFVIYGIFIGAIPIVITNSFIMAINIYYLIQMYRRDISSFSYMPADEGIEALSKFVALKDSDIRRFYPDFRECHLRAATAGRGRIYKAVKGNRIQGFAFCLYDESLELGQFCGEEDGFRAALRSIRENDYQGQPVFFVDYIVGKYRDLGLARKFHEHLVKDLSSEFKEFIWVNHHSNRKMRRLLGSLGYEGAFSSGEYEILKLKLVEKTDLPVSA